MINLETITNIRFAFNQPNVIKFEYTLDNGAQKTAALAVPDQLGKNREFDYIVNKYGQEFIQEKEKEMFDRVERHVETTRLREEGKKNSQELSALYSYKEKVLELFFVKENPTVATDVRSAPCIELVTCIMISEYESYRKEHNLTHEQMSDKQEDFLYD